MQYHYCETAQTLTLTGVNPPVAANKARVNFSNLITLSGTGFQPGMRVKVNELISADVQVKSQTEATAVLPESPDSCGLVELRVTTPDGQSAASSTLFRYGYGVLGFPRASNGPISSTTQNLAVLPPSSASSGLILLPDSFTSTLQIMKLNPDGSGATPVSRSSSRGINDLFIADLNKDDYLDMVALNGSAITAWVGQKEDIAEDPTTSFNIIYQNSAYADINQDGYGDLITISSTGQLQLRNNTHPNVGFDTVQATVFSASVVSPTGLAAADFDGDGKGDIAVLGTNSSGIQLAVYFGTGAPADFTTLAPLELDAVIENPTALISLNLDGDTLGRRDFLIVDSSGKLSLLVNQGNRRFGPAIVVPLSMHPDVFEVGDLNCDGLPEFIFTAMGPRTASVLRNLGTQPYFKDDEMNRDVLTTTVSLRKIVAAPLDSDSWNDLSFLGASLVSAGMELELAVNRSR